MTLKIYHNPRCSKSRQTLVLIETAKTPVETILYLEDPLTVADIIVLLTKLDFKSARQLMRKGEAIYKELNLKDETDETALIEAMAAHPKLMLFWVVRPKM